MDHVSRPLIALLLGTVAFFALWVVALKPSSSSSASSSGLGAYSSAIQAAHGAVATANAASAAHGGTVPQTASVAATSASAPTHSTAQASAAAPTSTTAQAASQAGATVQVHRQATVQQSATHARAHHVHVVVVQTAAQRYAVVQRALRQHKVLALLFYNPAATDDRAVKAELHLVPTHHGAVVTEAIPLAELSLYTTITAQVQVNQSPTLVVIDRARGASTIVGYTTDYEISQRIDDALVVH